MPEGYYFENFFIVLFGVFGSTLIVDAYDIHDRTRSLNIQKEIDL